MKKKRFLYIVLAIAVAFGATSCKKDGVYHPLKKISKIYIQEEGQDKELYSEWTWKGSNLQQIAYPLNRDTAHFSYEKGVISKITYTGISPRYLSFQYDKNSFSKMNLYEENTLLVSYQFFYDKKKISKIIVTEYVPNKSSVQYLGDLFTLLSLPDVAAESVEMATLAHAYKGGGSGSGGGNSDGGTTVRASYSFSFTWDGKKNNIIQIVTQTNSLRTTMRYLYDEKKNPFKGLQTEASNDATMGYVYDAALCNKNNVVKSQLWIGEEPNLKEHSTIQIDYVYNKKYPVMATSTQKFADISHFEKVITRWYEYK
jgi:hypothetical protein